MGVMMLATLGLTQHGDYHRLNALKNMLAMVIAAVAILVFVLGGVVGSVGGTRAAERLGERSGRLTTVFAGLIFVVAIYMLWRSAASFMPGMTS